MQFIVKIDLGNEAMQTKGDVVSALGAVADRLRRADGESDSLGVGFWAVIRDANGNRVGNASVQEAVADE